VTVRSRRVFGPSVVTAAGYRLLYTVPAGRTLVVRRLAFAARTANHVFAWFYVNAGAVNNLVRFLDIPAGTWSVSDDTWWVLNPGDTLYCYCNPEDTVVTLFGALLDGAPS